MAPLVLAALKLAPLLIPEALRALSGDKAAETASKVISAAKAVTGQDEPEVAVNAVLSNPEAQLKLTELLSKERVRFAELAVESKRIDVDNVIDARKRQIALNDPFPKQLAILLIVMLAAEQAAVFMGLMPDDETAKAIVLKGANLIEAAILLMLGFFYGSSVGSQRKDELLANSQPVK